MVSKQKNSLDQWEVGEHVPALLTWVSNKTSATGSHIYKHYFQLGIVDWRVMAYLGVFGTGTNGQICDFIGLDKGAVSRSITNLLDSGHIVMRTIDGRTAEVKLTSKGVRTANKMLVMAEKIEQELLFGIPEEECAAFKTTLKKMLENLPRLRSLLQSEGVKVFV